MASIVLILGHPSLGYPEATVRTHFVGQSRNLWNVGGYGLRIFTSGGFGLIAVSRSGETKPASERNRPAARLGRNTGSSAACTGRNHPDITF